MREWYHPVAAGLLQEAARAGGPLRLIIDGSKVGNGHQLLMVSLAYRRRALPLAWTWVRCKRGHSSGQKQCALLAYVHGLVPAGIAVVVIGDSEFSPLQAALESWDWFYALRQKGSHLIRLAQDQAWQRCDTLLTRPGQRCWLTNIELTQQHLHPCNFFALWQPDEKVPWLLATNLPTARLARLHYSRRMWTEGMFGDFKGNGFDLEASHLQHFLHLSRLTGYPGIMKKAGGEARGYPRTAKFAPEIGGSLPAKKVGMNINRGVKVLDPAKDCGPVPKGHRA